MSLNLPRTVAVKAAGWFDQGAIKIDVLRVCGLGLGWAWPGSGVKGGVWARWRNWGFHCLPYVVSVLYLCEVVTSSCADRH